MLIDQNAPSQSWDNAQKIEGIAAGRFLAIFVPKQAAQKTFHWRDRRDSQIEY
jgi:hypothetical protein